MPDGEDYLWRPVMRGMLTAMELQFDPRVDLAFIARCNDAIDVEMENQMRADAHMRAQMKKG